MPNLRVYHVDASTPPAPTSLRLYRLSGTGSSPSVPKLRVYRINGAGSSGVTLSGPATAVEPGSTVTITAVDSGGGSLPSASWRVSGVTAGPKPVLTAPSSVCTFVAPGVKGGTTITIGCTVGSVETFVNVAVLGATIFVNGVPAVLYVTTPDPGAGSYGSAVYGTSTYEGTA